MLIGLVYSSVPLRDGLIWFFLSVPGRDTVVLSPGSVLIGSSRGIWRANILCCRPALSSFLLSTLVRFCPAQVECLGFSCSCWFGGGGLPWFGDVVCLLFPSASAEVVG